MTAIRKAVITAAGRGTRMYPASATVQKELFPLVDVDGFVKPTLQIIVEEALASGLEEICLVVNPENEAAIRAHFRGLSAEAKSGQFRGKDWALPLSDALDDMARRLTFVIQETQEGYGHAVLQAREWVGNSPFALLLGDHVYRSFTAARCARQVLDAFAAFGGVPVSSVARVPEASVPRLGTIRGRRIAGTDPPVYEAEAMAEKPSVEEARRTLRTPGLPEGEYLCFFGIHAFPAEIFECLQHLVDQDIRQRGEIQMTAAQDLLFRRGRYLICEVAGERYDMGVPEGLIETQIALALRSPYRDAARHLFAPMDGHS